MTYFRCFFQSCDCQRGQWHGWESVWDKLWMRRSGFLAWFVSQIFLLLFWLISSRTFYYWQYLSQDGCGPLFDVKTLWKRRVIKTKLLLLRKKLNLLSTVQSWAGEKSFFSKAPTLGGVHPISSHKWWPNIFQQKLVHQYIVSPTKLSRYHETEEEVEGGSLRNIEAGRPGEPMSNHYFSV